MKDKQKTKRTSFVLHMDLLESIMRLSDQEIGLIFRQIYNYRLTGIEPNEFSQSQTQTSLTAFHFFRIRMKSDDEKFEKTCEMRRILGAFGGLVKSGNVEGALKLYDDLAKLPKASIGYQTLPKVSKSYQKLAKLAERRGDNLTTFDYSDSPDVESHSKILEDNKSPNCFALPLFRTHEEIKKITLDQLKKLFREQHLLKGNPEDMHNHYCANGWTIPHGDGSKKVDNMDSLIAVAKKWDKRQFKQYNNYQGISRPIYGDKLSIGQKNRLIIEEVEQDFINLNKK